MAALPRRFFHKKVSEAHVLSSDLEGSFDSSLHGCVQADAAEPHLLWFGEKVGSDELGKRTS